jgi:ABC-type multidrug transport system ATPase subunit
MTVGAALLTVAGLSARRGARQVLNAVSFTVRPGEILGVIGPNGAGKTTLFECVAGLLPCSSGEIRHAPGSSLYYVPDAIRPWPEQTVRWTLDLTARMFGTAVDATLVSALELDGLLNAPVKTLSKGEAKRAGIAIGLTVPRPLILLDEPFDGLDLRQTRHIISLLRRTVAQGRTLVLSIHQLSDAARVCDRFLLLDHGRSIAAGTLEELVTQTGTGVDSLEEVFLALT